MSERQTIQLSDLSMPGIYPMRTLTVFDPARGTELSSLNDGITFHNYYNPDSQVTRVPAPRIDRIVDTPDARLRLLRLGGEFVRQTQNGLYIQVDRLSPVDEYRPDIKARFAELKGFALRPAQGGDEFDCLPVTRSVDRSTIGYLETPVQEDSDFIFYRGKIV